MTHEVAPELIEETRAFCAELEQLLTQMSWSPMSQWSRPGALGARDGHLSRAGVPA